MSASAEPAAGTGTWRRLAPSGDLEGHGPFALAVDGLDVAVVRRGGAWLALSGLCPHQGALLGEGELDGGALVCRNHGWRFDVATGERRGGPQCLARFPVMEEDGWLWIDVARRERQTSSQATGPLRCYDDLPGPTGLPLLGNAHQLDLAALHRVLEGWARTYGPVFRFRIGRRRYVGVADADIANQALRARPETFRRTSSVESVFRELGVDGVFSAEGAAWRPQRRLAMQALAQRNLRGFYPALAQVAGTLHRRWLVAAEEGRILDVQDEMMRFTVDVTTALVFGHNVNTLENDEDPIQRQLAPVFPAFNRRLFAVLPYWRLVRLPRDRQLERSLAAVREWLSEVIEAARRRMEAQPDRRQAPENFLEAMLTATDEHGEPFSDEVIYANSITMLLAGEDTTANTLSWAVHHLCDAPAAKEELCGELDAALGASSIPESIDIAQSLSFATAITDEAMRLRPVAPLIFLDANQDTTVGDLQIARQMGLALLTRPPVLDAELLAEPEAFRPERWRDETVVDRLRRAYAHIPFGSGPRICPGRSLAILEMRIVLATLYRSFEVERIGSPEEVEEKFSFTMAPTGLRVRLHRRQTVA